MEGRGSNEKGEITFQPQARTHFGSFLLENGTPMVFSGDKCVNPKVQKPHMSLLRSHFEVVLS